MPAKGDQPRGSTFAANAAGAPFNGEDRRRHDRVGFATKAWIHEVEPGCLPSEGQTADASDISRSGIGLRCRRMYYVGRLVIVMLHLPSGEVKFMSGLVRSSRYTYAGLYHVGIEFCPMPVGDHMNNWMRARARTT
jgi:hypothetical protein